MHILNVDSFNEHAQKDYTTTCLSCQTLFLSFSVPVLSLYVFVVAVLNI